MGFTYKHTKALCYPSRRPPTTKPIVVSRQTFHISSISRSTSYLARCARTISLRFIRSPISCMLFRMGKTAINYTRTTEWCQYFHSGIHYLASTSHPFGNNKGTHSLFVIFRSQGNEVCSSSSFDPSCRGRAGHWDVGRVHD